MFRSKVFNNAGLCGFRISVGAIGTAYTGGWGGTALDTACTSALKDQINYLSCIANPAGCTELCAASPSLSRAGVCEGSRGNSVTRSVAERRVETGRCRDLATAH